MTIDALRRIDMGIDSSVRVAYAKADRYCVEAAEQIEGGDSVVAHYEGPGGSIVDGPCPPG